MHKKYPFPLSVLLLHVIFLYENLLQDKDELALCGIMQSNINALKEKYDIVISMTNDKTHKSFYRYAAYDVQQKRAAMQTIIKVIRFFAELALKSIPEHLSQFPFVLLHRSTNEEYLARARTIATLATHYQTELSAKGLDSTLPLQLLTLADEFETLIREPAETIKNRKLTTKQRITLSNELWNEIREYSKRAIFYFETTGNERKSVYDYFLHKIQLDRPKRTKCTLQSPAPQQ